ncbi:MAG: hypothetical protein Tsb002_10110 [Wenzhouxiangellaceae bacterium]
MLVISLRADQSVDLEIDPDLPAELRVSDLLDQQPIRVTVVASGISFARIGIDLPREFRIRRHEALPPDGEEVKRNRR